MCEIKEVKKLYQVDKIPKLAQQKKTVGGQCAFQAHRNLMKSISSIASDPKQAKFIDDNIIRQTMSNTVRDILALMEAGKIPVNEWKSRHLYPGDVELKEFSVFAFKKMSGRLTPYYRYKEMRITGGINCGLGWVVTETASWLFYRLRQSRTNNRSLLYFQVRCFFPLPCGQYREENRHRQQVGRDIFAPQSGSVRSSNEDRAFHSKIRKVG